MQTGQITLQVDPERVPEAVDRLGAFIGTFWGVDVQASSRATRALLDWTPTGPTLLEDIAAGGYPGV